MHVAGYSIANATILYGTVPLPPTATLLESPGTSGVVAYKLTAATGTGIVQLRPELLTECLCTFVCAFLHIQHRAGGCRRIGLACGVKRDLYNLEAAQHSELRVDAQP